MCLPTHILPYQFQNSHILYEGANPYGTHSFAGSVAYLVARDERLPRAVQHIEPSTAPVYHTAAARAAGAFFVDDAVRVYDRANKTWLDATLEWRSHYVNAVVRVVDINAPTGFTSRAVWWDYVREITSTLADAPDELDGMPKVTQIQVLPDGYDLVPLPCGLPTELTEQAAAFFPDTDEIRAARAHKPSQYEVRVIWHGDPSTVTLYDPVSGYVINYDEMTGTAYMTGDVATRYLQDLTDTRK